MSRGHGWVQQEVLHVLRVVAEGGLMGTGVPLSLIVPAVYSNRQPMRKHTESVRRAVKKLAAEELVVLGYEVTTTDDGVTGGAELTAHLVPTPAMVGAWLETRPIVADYEDRGAAE